MISAQRLREIFNDCLLGNTNPTTEAVILINGVNGTFGLDPEKVDIHLDEIKEMLDQLPSQFREASEGGSDGYSFMALPFDSTGAQWGEQINANELMVLGLATGYMQYLFSAEFWSALPGSVPYVLIHKDPVAVKRDPFNSYGAGERSIEPLIM